MHDSNMVYQKQILDIVNNKDNNFKQIYNKCFFITGATGLIGSLFAGTLLKLNDLYNANIRLIILVRNIDKAKKIFGDRNDLKIIVGDICDEFSINEKIDYILHAASQTSSMEFINNPINTIDVSVLGTKNVLELAKRHNVHKLIYLSTMEVYGRPQNDDKIDENFSCNLLTNEIRNCYPLSKILCENMTFCYSNQFGFESNVLRLTQTFGAGVDINDSRVFAQFARSILNNENVVLKTLGETKRSYLYTGDCIKAILLVLIKGINGEIYNVANEDTYCSIYEMAKIVCKLNSKSSVVFDVDINATSKFGFAPKLNMNLDCKKIYSLGWKPSKNLLEMYVDLIEYWKQNKIEK